MSFPTSLLPKYVFSSTAEVLVAGVGEDWFLTGHACFLHSLRGMAYTLINKTRNFCHEKLCVKLSSGLIKSLVFCALYSPQLFKYIFENFICLMT